MPTVRDARPATSIGRRSCERIPELNCRAISKGRVDGHTSFDDPNHGTRHVRCKGSQLPELTTGDEALLVSARQTLVDRVIARK